MTHTIGQRLKTEREEQRLTLEKVFEATRIRIQYLQALEADDLSVMPSSVQARGYLRNYAEYLGLDVDQMLNGLHELTAQQTSGEVIGPTDDPSLPPQQDSKAVDILQVSSPLERSDIPPKKPISVEEITIPIKPKPSPALSSTDGSPIRVPQRGAANSEIAGQGRRTLNVTKTEDKSTRRKKADGDDDQPKLASAEPTTKRRGRKKSEPVSAPLVDEIIVPVESMSPSGNDDEPITLAESVPNLDAVEAPAEPVAEEAIPLQQDPSEQATVSDNLWQRWLNRFGSVLSARMKRRTLTPKESSTLESEPIAESLEQEVPAEVGIHNPSFESSAGIFKEIGRELRTRRELLSLHFDEVERNTHVKAHYLDALERGALDELPSTVQTRGMLSNYATFLDLDVDVLLLRFADALQARHRERNPQKPARKPGQPIIPNMPPVRSFIAGDMIFGVSMAILLVGFAIWGVSRVMTIQSQREVKPTAPSISDVLLASPDPSLSTATATFLPVESFPGEATVTVEIPTQNVNAEVQLNLVAVERTYMRVTVDGEVVFDGRVVPGNAYPFEAENQIEVLVGSGAAIRTVYNGRDLGLMGTFGQVVNNIYSSTEVITPTALPTATATITLTPTSTAPPTPTSRFTATPVPSDTPVP